MGYSQDYLNDQWRILKEPSTNEYAEARISGDPDDDLVQQMELDVVATFGSFSDTSKTIAYWRGRESPDVEWGMWEEGRLAPVPTD